MRYAIIGCGRISPNHVVASQKTGLDLVALCDLDLKNTEDKIKKFDLDADYVKQYTDYKKMLEEMKPELVAIATESGKHAQIALDCIEAGCNVIIEKPIALSLADADRIIEAGHNKGVKVCACHQNRFNKSIQMIREALEKGRFGRGLVTTNTMTVLLGEAHGSRMVAHL